MPELRNLKLPDFKLPKPPESVQKAIETGKSLTTKGKERLRKWWNRVAHRPREVLDDIARVNVDQAAELVTKDHPEPAGDEGVEAVRDLQVPEPEPVGKEAATIPITEVREKENQLEVAKPVSFKRERGRDAKVSREEKDRLIGIISTTANGDSTTEVVYTSEYCLFSNASEATPIRFNEEGKAIDGQETVVEAIGEITKIAVEANKIIVLSGICEELTLKSGTKVSMNASLIIYPDGTSRRRYKVSDSYDKVKVGDQWTYEQLMSDDAREKDELAYSSVQNFELPSGKTVGIVVCNEIGDLHILEKITPDTDILLIPKSGYIQIPPFVVIDAEYENTVISHLNTLVSTINHLRSKPLTISVADERTGQAATGIYSSTGNLENIEFQ